MPDPVNSPAAPGAPTESPATPDALRGVDAVTEAMPQHAAIVALRDLLTDAKWDRRELTLTVEANDIARACQAAKAAGYNFFEDLTGVDWYPSEPRFQLSYSLLSHAMKQRIRLVVRLVGDAPSLPTVTGVWPAANFYEREVFDLFGIVFNGHPRLTRIMMPDNWKGHPLRKDYPVEGYR